jgi:hypothetical protein
VERVTRVLESAGLGTSRNHLEDVAPPSSQLAARTGHAWGASGVKRGGAGKLIGIAVAVLLLAGVAVGGALMLRSGPEPAASAAPSVGAAPVPAAPSIAAETPVSATPAPTRPAPSASVATTTPRATSTSDPRPAVIPSPTGPRPARTAALSPTPPKPTAAPAPAPPPGPAPKPAKKPDLYGDRK